MDTSLVQGLKQGDRETFALIFREYWKPLLSFASKRMTLMEDAEEVVQEVFISLWERRAGIDIHISLSAYLHAAVKYRVYNKYREWLRRNKSWRIPGLTNVDYELPALDQLAYKELELKLRTAIGKLPQRCREAFVLSRDEQLPNRTIAERLNISVNTVEKHIGKALLLLRAELYDERC